MAIDPTKAWESSTFESDRMLLSARFSPCGKFLAAVGVHEPVTLWDVESGAQTLLTAHQTWVSAVVFHPTDKLLFTGDVHGTMHCWKYDPVVAKPVWSRAGEQSWVRAMAISADGQHLFSAGNDQVVHVWSTRDGSHQRQLEGHQADVYSLMLDPDGKTLLSGDVLGEILVWDLASGKQTRKIDASALHTRGEDFLADVGGARSMALSADGKTLAVGGMTDSSSNTFCNGKPAVLLLDYATGKLQETLRPTVKGDGPIEGLAYLADGTLAAQNELLNSSTSLEFWKPGEAKSFHQIKRTSGYSIDVHPDGQRIAVTTHKPNGPAGNPTKADPETYTSHNGTVVIYSLFEKPASEKPDPKAKKK